MTAGTRSRALAALLLAWVPLAEPAAGVETLTEGGWFADIGADRIIFVFTGPAEAPKSGMSHSLSGGRQYTQCPFTVERYDHPDVDFVMRTGVRYRGRVDLETGRICGRLLWGDDRGMDLDLVWLDPTTEPGVTARAGAGRYTYAPPSALEDGWRTADAGDHGLAPQVLEGIVAAVADGQAGLLHSLLVVRDEALIMEEYFHGYDRAALHPQASVTKSISSLLVGLALGRGEIADLQTPLLDFFPAAKPQDGRWRMVTLSHLLTMSAGLDWTDEQAEGIHGTGPEFFDAVLNRSFATDPGVVFRYVNADVNLLSGVIKEATGLFPDEFAERHLFTPLGIREWDWDHAAQDGHRLMDGSLQLRPRDMARIGQLVLAGGRWQGQQLLPTDFTHAAGAHQLDAGDQLGMQSGYGYLWWTLGIDSADRPLEIAFANGWGSQFIFVVPQLDLVIVTTGGNQDNGMHLAPYQVVCAPLLRAIGS